MANFILAFQKTIGHEGGWVNDPDDPGGETYKGVSRKNWPKWIGWHTIDLMKKQPGFPNNLERHAGLREELGFFYLNNFWNKLRADEIFNQAIAESIFDFAVNAGVPASVSLAQKVAGCKADGVIGPVTINALNSMNPQHFQSAFTVEKIKRYIEICNKRPVSKKFFFGWVSRAIGILFLFILSGCAFSQSYVKVADRAEFEKYQAYCNDSILVDIVQYGKVNIPEQHVSGLDFEMAKMMPGEFTDIAVKPDTFWYAAWKPGAKATRYTIDSNQARVTRIIRVKVPRRIASIKDFYLNWQTGRINSEP